MNICSLLKFQGRPWVRRVEGGFVKKGKKYLPLLKEVLSKGGLVKLAPVVQWLECWSNA